MKSVGILGASGYTALELIKLLLRHPEVNIVALTTRQDSAPHVSAVHPQLTGRLDLNLTQAEPAELADQCDCVFSCLPHAASRANLGERVCACVCACVRV
ncbi:MAG: N-acetyl-gamma-glutamyl-phosphate reductase, partial [Planctomycetota bacterium]